VLHTAENIMMLSKKAHVRFGIGEYHPNHGDTREMVDTVGQEILGVTRDEGSNMLKASPTLFDCRMSNKRLWFFAEMVSDIMFRPSSSSRERRVSPIGFRMR
jgi:hypothetical protein